MCSYSATCGDHGLNKKGKLKDSIGKFYSYTRNCVYKVCVKILKKKGNGKNKICLHRDEYLRMLHSTSVKGSYCYGRVAERTFRYWTQSYSFPTVHKCKYFN